MNAIANLLAAEDICLGVEVTGKPQLFDTVGRLMAQNHGLSAVHVAHALARREAVGSTALGEGIAIPHARVKDLRRPLAAYLRPKLPMPFSAPDERPVFDILVLLVPAPAVEAHLLLLAEASQMLGDSGFRRQLRSCIAAREVLRVFAAWPKLPG